MFILVVSAVVISLASGAKQGPEFNCTGAPEGLAWWGCRSYGICSGGEHIQTDCVNGTAYDQDSEQCGPSDSVAWPCNRQADCSSLNGTVHRLPEIDTQDGFEPCQFYFTCNYGLYAGHQMCNMGLVYNEAEQRCSYPEFVPPPCGTRDL